MAQLDLSNIINISVSQSPAGIGALNTSNIALFSTETPGGTFPSGGYGIYLSPDGVATDFGSSSTTYKMALAVFSQSPNILANGGYLVVIPFLSAETLDAAITRTKDLVQYFGIMSTRIETQVDMLAAAAVVQALPKIAFFVSKTSTDVASGGKLDLLRSGNFTHSRGLYYGASATVDALIMMASYAGRGLSTNFSGSNTTQTMQLKDLAGVQPDSSMTQTIYNNCLTAGVDVYASVQGVAKVLTSGANGFFDDVYNLQWFVIGLQVAGFNALAQSSTKIPQTENGVSALKSAYRQVCEQGVNNQYIAPGQWTSATTFGSLTDFLANISQRGYYIYSSPVSQQLATDRAARKAPLIQIAIKEAGAIHSSSVIVNVNV
jgi:hypothetical protein